MSMEEEARRQVLAEEAQRGREARQRARARAEDSEACRPLLLELVEYMRTSGDEVAVVTEADPERPWKPAGRYFGDGWSITVQWDSGEEVHGASFVLLTDGSVRTSSGYVHQPDRRERRRFGWSRTITRVYPTVSRPVDLHPVTLREGIVWFMKRRAEQVPR